MSTPAALLNNIDPDKPRRLEFLRYVKYVVYFLWNYLELIYWPHSCKSDVAGSCERRHYIIMHLFTITGRYLMKQICFSVGGSKIKLFV